MSDSTYLTRVKQESVFSKEGIPIRKIERTESGDISRKIPISKKLVGITLALALSFGGVYWLGRHHGRIESIRASEIPTSSKIIEPIRGFLTEDGYFFIQYEGDKTGGMSYLIYSYYDSNLKTNVFVSPKTAKLLKNTNYEKNLR